MGMASTPGAFHAGQQRQLPMHFSTPPCFLEILSRRTTAPDLATLMPQDHLRILGPSQDRPEMVLHQREIAVPGLAGGDVVLVG
jgi:hypothetical protein